MLRDADVYFRRAARGRPVPEWLSEHPAGELQARARELWARPLQGPVDCRANWGRWIVDCPDCPSAQLASRADRRFLCADCGAGPFRVSWPQNPDRIEQLLERREVRFQNWVAGETVSVLRAQNRRLGVEDS